jgi:hypothetical protein
MSRVALQLVSRLEKRAIRYFAELRAYCVYLGRLQTRHRASNLDIFRVNLKRQPGQDICPGVDSPVSILTSLFTSDPQESDVVS